MHQPEVIFGNGDEALEWIGLHEFGMTWFSTWKLTRVISFNIFRARAGRANPGQPEGCPVFLNWTAQYRKFV
jgi:hypothetical protein